MSVYEKCPADVCGNCRHFRLHYIFRHGAYSPLAYGHCVFPRFKSRAVTQTCPHWEKEKGEA